MKTELYSSISEFETHVFDIVRELPKPVSILAGHFPVDSRGNLLVSDDDAFGVFPQYTLDLGCRIVKTSSDINLVLLIDDHSQTGSPGWYLEENSEFEERLNQIFSGFKLPQEYIDILRRHSLDDRIFQRNNGSLIFRESDFRKRFYEETRLNPGCAGEYKKFLEEMERLGRKSLFSFIPMCCQGPTCNAVKQITQSPLTVVHAYLATGNITDLRTLEQKTKDIYGGIPIIR